MYRPPSTPDPNSLAAAQSVEQTAPAQRKRVLLLIEAIGPLSAEQIQDQLHLAGNSVRPRIVELEQDRLIVKDGQGRTRAGRRCHLYRATSLGHLAVHPEPEQLGVWG